MTYLCKNNRLSLYTYKNSELPLPPYYVVLGLLATQVDLCCNNRGLGQLKYTFQKYWGMISQKLDILFFLKLCPQNTHRQNGSAMSNHSTHVHQ